MPSGRSTANPLPRMQRWPEHGRRTLAGMGGDARGLNQRRGGKACRPHRVDAVAVVDIPAVEEQPELTTIASQDRICQPPTRFGVRGRQEVGREDEGKQRTRVGPDGSRHPAAGHPDTDQRTPRVRIAHTNAAVRAGWGSRILPPALGTSRQSDATRTDAIGHASRMRTDEHSRSDRNGRMGW